MGDCYWAYEASGIEPDMVVVVRHLELLSVCLFVFCRGVAAAFVRRLLFCMEEPSLMPCVSGSACIIHV